MLNILFVIVVGAVIFVTGFALGNEAGWKDVHRGTVVCVTAIDGKPYCVRKSEVKP